MEYHIYSQERCGACRAGGCARHARRLERFAGHPATFLPFGTHRRRGVSTRFVNQAAELRYMLGGRPTVPLVIRVRRAAESVWRRGTPRVWRRGPIMRVAGCNVPMSYNDLLERAMIPTPQDVAATIRGML